MWEKIAKNKGEDLGLGSPQALKMELALGTDNDRNNKIFGKRDLRLDGKKYLSVDSNFILIYH